MYILLNNDVAFMAQGIQIIIYTLRSRTKHDISIVNRKVSALLKVIR
jgi:hypothetical protein